METNSSTVEKVTEAVHQARFWPGVTPTAFADEDRRGQEYCRRIAHAAIVADDRAKKLEEAVTPSLETKAAYIGEFSLRIEEGEYGYRIIPVPWTTIKEIMAAIRKQAGIPDAHS